MRHWNRHGGDAERTRNLHPVWNPEFDTLAPGGINVLFVDGHVEWLSVSELNPFLSSYWRGDAVAAKQFGWR